MSDTTDNRVADNGCNVTANDSGQCIFNVRRADEWVSEAIKRPNPRQLWKELWYENEVACLFADTNVGKSIYAVEIAGEIAKTDRVLYFDFEMSDKQFQMRYTDPDEETPLLFGDNFFRVEYRKDCALIDDTEAVASQIVMAALEAEARIIIVDNISWVCNRSEDGDAAGRLMLKLVEMKQKHNLSILVLAHTPKRNTRAPLNQNSLAGSKKLANFFDSIFAIGLDKNNKPSGRYIKQIKTRTGEMLYGDNNVIVCNLQKDGPWLHFEETGYNWECKLLDDPDADDIDRGEATKEISRAEEKKKKKEEVKKLMREGVKGTYLRTKYHLSPNTLIKWRKEIESEDEALLEAMAESARRVDETELTGSLKYRYD